LSARIRLSVGPGEHVDADAAEQDALGLGDELVARADENVGRRHVEQPEGHRGNALHTAHGEDRVGTADIGGVDDGRDAIPTSGRGGEHTVMCLQPATLAVVTVMIAEATWL
jgi:hypothetical protein